MAVRKNPSLSDVLAAFRNAQVKTAEEELPAEAAAPEAAAVEAAPEACPECGSPDGVCVCEQHTEVGELAAAAEALDAASHNADEAEQVAEEAKEEVAEAKDALKAVADDFINEHTASLKKEAQVFGQLFAASCLEEMNKTAALQDAQENAYSAAAEALNANSLQKCAEEAYMKVQDALNDVPMVKQAAMYEEAYRMVMAKLAGFDDPEAMEAAAGQELTPEDMAAIVAAQQEEESEPEPESESESEAEPEATEGGEAPEDPLAGLSEEEIAAIAAQLAEENGEEKAEGEASEEEPDGTSPEAVAEAANLLAAAREAENAEDEGEEGKTASVKLDKTASAAYDVALKAFGF